MMIVTGVPVSIASFPFLFLVAHARFQPSPYKTRSPQERHRFGWPGGAGAVPGGFRSFCGADLR